MSNKCIDNLIHFADPDDPSTFDDVDEDGFVITRAVYITVIIVFAYIILVFGLMIWCRVRRKARKAHIQLIDKEANENNTGGHDHGNDEIAPCLSPVKKKARKAHNGVIKANGTNGKAPIDTAQKSDDTAASNHSKISKKSNFDQITIPRTALFDINKIGRGDFGDVLTAKIKSSDLKHVNQTTNDNDITKLNDIQESDSADGVKHALIKALNKIKDESVCIEFRRQIEMFRTISHPNVVKLFGLCRDKDPHYLVLEHTDYGDLKQYLSTAKTDASKLNDTKPNIKPLRPSIHTMEQTLSMAQQIARGMDAVYRARYIHKDVAARNCIILNNFTVKISYPALNKEPYNHEYYLYKNASVPLRWMAPECLEMDEHTIKSDVYSFGVLVWELFHPEQNLPEPSLTDEEFLINLQSGKLIRSLPDSVPEKLKTILVGVIHITNIIRK